MDQLAAKIYRYSEEPVSVTRTVPADRWTSYTHDETLRIGRRVDHAQGAFDALDRVLSVLALVNTQDELGLVTDILDAIESAFE